MKADQLIAVLDEPLCAPSSCIDYDVLSGHIGFAAHRALLVLKREFAADVPVRPKIFNALVLIGANPGITQSELAAALILDKGTAAHLLRDLEKQGWIERKNRLDDRRWKGVYLSPSGVQALDRLKADVKKLGDRIHVLYTKAELKQLLEMLNRMFERFASDQD
jgi:DNA-binding MarR family transcriptional regulator